MTSAQKDSSPKLYPAFRYRDAQAAMKWLERAFGFKTQMTVPTPDGAVAHAELSFGTGGIFLGSARNDPDNPWSNVPFGVYGYVADIESHYRQAKAAGAEIVRELQDTPYGSREYSVRDLDGFLWSFGTYRPPTEE